MPEWKHFCFGVGIDTCPGGEFAILVGLFQRVGNHNQTIALASHESETKALMCPQIDAQSTWIRKIIITNTLVLFKP
jgi:hypothetical protein